MTGLHNASAREKNIDDNIDDSIDDHITVNEHDKADRIPSVFSDYMNSMIPRK